MVTDIAVVPVNGRDVIVARVPKMDRPVATSAGRYLRLLAAEQHRSLSTEELPVAWHARERGTVTADLAARVVQRPVRVADAVLRRLAEMGLPDEAPPAHARVGRGRWKERPGSDPLSRAVARTVP